MACVHLQQLYKLCQEHDLKLGAPDLVRVVCHQCGEQEVCPSMLMDMDLREMEQTQQEEEAPPQSESRA